MDSAEFTALVNEAMRQPERGLMRPVIEKELLHYDILFALSQARNRGQMKVFTLTKTTISLYFNLIVKTFI